MLGPNEFYRVFRHGDMFALMICAMIDGKLYITDPEPITITMSIQEMTDTVLDMFNGIKEPVIDCTPPAQNNFLLNEGID